MPKSKKPRTEAQKAAAKKAAATLKKRLAAEKRQAIATGKPPPLTPAQKAWETIRARKEGRETKRKENEAKFKKDLGQKADDIRGRDAEVAPSATGPMTPTDRLSTAPDITKEGSEHMTSMRAAFEKAGVNTLKLELDERVKELLARNKNQPTGIIVGFDHLIMRRHDLRKILLLDYATRVAGNGQDMNDTQRDHAASSNAVGQTGLDTHSASADPAPGQHANDAQSSVAGSAYKREHVYHVRTPAQKAAAREAMAKSLGIWSRKIGDRPIGDLAWGELQELRRQSIRTAGAFVRDGLYCAADALLIEKILAYAKVTDMSTLVKNVVPDEAMQRLNHEAAKEAPIAIDIGRVAYESALTKQIEHRP